MIQYFQLTPEILLEYVYENDPKLNIDGVKGNVKDINNSKTKTMLLKSDVFASKYLCFKDESEGLDSVSNLVLPLNNTETEFVVAKSKHQNFYSIVNPYNFFSTETGSGYRYEDTNYDKNINSSCDVKYDKCIIHFTSKNCFGTYDSLIFQAYAYMKNKAKLYLASFLFKKTSNFELKAEHMLYNEKLYTTQVEFDIPSVYNIFVNDNVIFNKALASQINIEPVSDSDVSVDLLENTPIGINVYGVTGRSIINRDVNGNGYEKLKTLKIKSISIPYVYNRLDGISVNISESNDGDFYIIDPEMSSAYPSFVDYIESMGEDIRAYVVMHELSLVETWHDNNTGETINEVTHTEHHIIDINNDDEDEEISKKFDAKIKYRPICIRSDKECVATIIDTIKIINTVDSSSYGVSGSANVNPRKYGMKLNRLGIKNESRPIVNVYNKKVSEENNASSNILGLNKNGGFVIENHTQNITSFIECTNIGVSIVELSPDEMN